MQKVDFRYSDTDFVAYLLTLGYKHTHIEISLDKKFNRLKGFVHFVENKNELMKHFSDYSNGAAVASVSDIKGKRMSIKQLIQAEIMKQKAESNL